MNGLPATLAKWAALGLSISWHGIALAHDVAQGDRAFVAATDGPAIVPFLYLGAKHMVTGYDHILFLIGVVMFLHRFRDIVVYVSMFTIGHSITLMLGVLFKTDANVALVDAIIGVSILYKAFENLGYFEKMEWQFDRKFAVFGFGLVHGLGLATKILDLNMSANGLLTNLISFNVGVEIGQILVLVMVVFLFNLWRGSASFVRFARVANWGLFIGGAAIVIDNLWECGTT